VEAVRREEERLRKEQELTASRERASLKLQVQQSFLISYGWVFIALGLPVTNGECYFC
jgi:hypothetical protein